MTIGDVLAVTAAICAVGAAWMALLLLFALAFPVRTAKAQEKLNAAPGACFGGGLAVVLLGGLLALPSRSGQAAGRSDHGRNSSSAGAVRLLGERIYATGVGQSAFACLTRGAILYVLAGFLPVLVLSCLETHPAPSRLRAWLPLTAALLLLAALVLVPGIPYFSLGATAQNVVGLPNWLQANLAALPGASHAVFQAPVAALLPAWSTALLFGVIFLNAGFHVHARQRSVS